MSIPADIADRQTRVLTELTELGMQAARDLQAGIATAEAPEAKAALGLAFHRAARSVRQCLALELRLMREVRQMNREDHEQAAGAETARVESRKRQVRLAVERLIWDEAEDDEAEQLVDELDDRLDAAELSEDFAATPLEAHIARLTAELGLTAPATEADAAAAGGDAETLFDAAPPVPGLNGARPSPGPIAFPPVRAGGPPNSS